jgi:ribosome maturation factor RimP
MNNQLVDNIKNALDILWEDSSFSDCFLIDIHAKKQKVTVFIDADETMDFSKCKAISRYLEAIIEENKWLGEQYTLEVSSPGVGTPLKQIRQYPKNIGRVLSITQDDETLVEGLLKEVNEREITIEQEIMAKEGKKKIKRTEQKEIPFENIKEAIVKISF